MNNQKVNYIPTLDNVQIVNFDFENDILTDIIDMPESNKAWAIHINKLDASGTPVMTVTCSNDGINFVRYSTSSTDIDILTSRMIYGTEFCPRYMQIFLETIGGAAGDTISISIVK